LKFTTKQGEKGLKWWANNDQRQRYFPTYFHHSLTVGKRKHWENLMHQPQSVAVKILTLGSSCGVRVALQVPDAELDLGADPLQRLCALFFAMVA